MRLTGSEERALRALCDTFVPGGDGLPSASELGVPEALVQVVSRLPSSAERQAFRALLLAFDTPLPALVARKGVRRFAALSQAEREAILLAWADSALLPRRAGFQALRRGAAILYYILPGPDGRHPVWDRMGYPGPLGPPPNPPSPPLSPISVEGTMALDCDVCVVGSGAGGSVAAAVLAQAGLDVVVLEAGGYYDDRDFDGAEFAAYRRMYLGHAGLATWDQGVGLLAGACLGGGTTVNFSTSFATPEDVREEWAAHGVPAFAGQEYAESLDAVQARLGVNDRHSRLSARDEVMRRGLDVLGWHMGVMPRNVTEACDQGTSCGYCGYGCRLGAKQSGAKTWLVDAERAGARIVPGARATRVLVSSGRASGVEVQTAGGNQLLVRARAVVAAAGALNTPALLRRSGCSNRNIGRHLRLHPTTGVAGVFDEEIRPWEGTMQAIYSDQFRSLTGGYGVKFESAAFHPSVLAAFAPWRGAARHAELMGTLRHMVPVPVLVRERDGGRVVVGPDGEPIVHYRLSTFDTEHLRIGFEGAAQLLEAAGARRIFSAHASWVAYEPGAGRRKKFLSAADACGWGPGQCVLWASHITGSARMGGSPEDSACNPDGRVWEVDNLYVCDGSAFPTAPGVNPMISIEAVAHMNASRLAAALR